jgi:hypothetical protein
MNCSFNAHLQVRIEKEKRKEILANLLVKQLGHVMAKPTFPTYGSS